MSDPNSVARNEVFLNPHEVRKFLEKNEFYYLKYPTITESYTRQPNGHNKFDVVRLAKNQAAWRVKKLDNSQALPKTVVYCGKLFGWDKIKLFLAILQFMGFSVKVLNSYGDLQNINTVSDQYLHMKADAMRVHLSKLAQENNSLNINQIIILDTDTIERLLPEMPTEDCSNQQMNTSKQNFSVKLAETKNVGDTPLDVSQRVSMLFFNGLTTQDEFYNLSVENLKEKEIIELNLFDNINYTFEDLPPKLHCLSHELLKSDIPDLSNTSIQKLTVSNGHISSDKFTKRLPKELKCLEIYRRHEYLGELIELSQLHKLDSVSLSHSIKIHPPKNLKHIAIDCKFLEGNRIEALEKFDDDNNLKLITLYYIEFNDYSFLINYLKKFKKLEKLVLQTTWNNRNSILDLLSNTFFENLKQVDVINFNYPDIDSSKEVYYLKNKGSNNTNKFELDEVTVLAENINEENEVLIKLDGLSKINFKCFDFQYLSQHSIWIKDFLSKFIFHRRQKISISILMGNDPDSVDYNFEILGPQTLDNFLNYKFGGVEGTSLQDFINKQKSDFSTPINTSFENIDLDLSGKSEFQDHSVRFLDKNTYSDPNTEIQVTPSLFKCINGELTPLDPTLERITVLPELNIDEKGMYFSTKKNAYQEVNDNDFLVEEIFLDKIEGKVIGKISVTPGEWTVLPLSDSNSDVGQIHLLEEGATCKLRKNLSSRQVEINVTSSRRSVTLYYLPKPAEWPPLPTEIELSKSHEIFINEVLLKVLKLDPEKQKKVPPYFIELAKKMESFVKVQGEPSEELLSFIVEYCKDFCNLPLNENPKYLEFFADFPESARGQLQVLIEQNGACRHRAFAFALLLQCLRIPCSDTENKIHAFAERVNEEGGLVKQDLGGSRVKLNITFEMPKLLKSPQANTGKLNLSQAPTIFSRKFYKNLPSFFPQSPDWAKDCKNTEQLMEAIALNADRVAMTFNCSSDRSKFFSELFKAAKRKNQNIYYYATMESLDRDWETVTVDENQFSCKPGPLQEAQQKPDLIVLNVTNIKSILIKSLLDKPRTFNGVSVPPECRVLLLAPSQWQCSEDVQSRLSYFDWPAHVTFPEFDPLDAVFSQDSQINEESDSVDLYANPENIEEQLLESLGTDENQNNVVSPGKLIQLCQQAKSLSIYDPPANCLTQGRIDLHPALEELLFNVFIKRRVRGVFNSNEVAVNEAFSIRCQPAKSHLPLEILEENNFQLDSEPTTFYVNRTTFDRLFEEYKIIKDKPVRQLGWLHTFPEKQKHLCIVDDLSDKQVRKLSQEIQTLPEAFQNLKIMDLKHQDTSKIPEPKLESGAEIIITSDPGFLTDKIKKENKLAHDAIFYSSVQTQWSDLIEWMNQKDKSFVVKKQPILQKLIEGKTVIICGRISELLYQQLETLFLSPGYLTFNGERISIKGKLIFVTESLPFDPVLAKCCGQYSQRTITFDDYRELFLNQDENLEKVELFLKLAKRFKYPEDEGPQTLRFNYARLKFVLEQLKLPPSERLYRNPLKAFFQLDFVKSSEAYAFFNFLAKIIFDDGISDPKSTANNKPTKGQDLFWYKVNALNAQQIKTILNIQDYREILDLFNMDSSASLKPEYQQALLTHQPPQSVILSRESYKTRHLMRLEKALSVNSVVELKGLPDIDKSSYVVDLAKKLEANCFWYPHELSRWLDHRNKKNQAILIIEDANMGTDGVLDFLRGMPDGVYFQGQYYPLSENHKIVCVSDLENSPGRTYHQLLQDIPTLYMGQRSEEELYQEIVQPLEKALGLPSCKPLIRVYFKMMEQLKSHKIGTRDLTQLILLIKLRFNKSLVSSSQIDERIFYQVCYDYWRGCFVDNAELEQFMEILQQSFPKATRDLIVFNHSSYEEIAKKLTEKNLWLCPTTWRLLMKIVDNVRIHEQKPELLSAMNIAEKASTGKAGVSLKGGSGIGKSTLLREVLIAMGYQNQDPQQPKYFVQFTCGDVEHNEPQKKLLAEAFDCGWKIIVDEIDQDPEIEKELGQYLSGRPVTGKPASTPGFMVFASNNGVAFQDRFELSLKFVNQLDAIEVPTLKREDLLIIAEKALPDQECEFYHQLVDAYLQAAKQFPLQCNPRTFYEKLQQTREQFTSYQPRFC